jgi:sigma-E factor negative regulatory protein RseB
MSRHPIHPRHISALIFCCAVFGYGSSMAEERSAEDWLRAMSLAQQELNYSGTLSYFNGDELTTLDYRHMVVNGEVHQHVTPLNGPSRKFIREGHSLSLELDSDDELVQMREKIEDGGISTPFAPRFDKLGETYDISIDGSGRIANRSAVCVSMTPKEQDRYRIHLWIDEKTSILLRWDMRDHDNRPVSIWQFTDFEVIENDLDQHSFSDVPSAGATLDLKSNPIEVEHDEDEVHWHLDWVPKGFELSGASNQELSLGRDSSHNVMYSDGIVAVSVLVEPAPKSHEGVAMKSVLGSTVLHGRF